MNTMDKTEDELTDYAIRPNKTEIKREIAEVLALAEAISLLSLTQLNSFELPDPIFQGLRQVAKMPHKTARKREMKFITAQLRKVELAPIQEKLARFNRTSAHEIREHHQAEKWRDQLISDDPNALTQFLTQFPHADSQQLRQLQRKAKKELLLAMPPKSSRVLYQRIKEIVTH